MVKGSGRGGPKVDKIGHELSNAKTKAMRDIEDAQKERAQHQGVRMNIPGKMSQPFLGRITGRKIANANTSLKKIREQEHDREMFRVPATKKRPPTFRKRPGMAEL